MKVLSLLAAMLLTATVAMSCTETDSSDFKATETRNVEKFNRISVSAPVSVKIVCGQNQSLTVSGSEKTIARVKTEVIDGELIIKVDGPHVRINKKTQIDICVENITALRASGASFVHLPQYTVCDDLDLRVSGASDVLIGDLEVKGVLNAEVSGASDLDIEFKAGKSVFKVSGASDVDIDRIDTDEIDVTASGASDVDIRGKVNNLIIDASGASEINLRQLIFNNRMINASGASDIDF